MPVLLTRFGSLLGIMLVVQAAMGSLTANPQYPHGIYTTRASIKKLDINLLMPAETENSLLGQLVVKQDSLVVFEQSIGREKNFVTGGSSYALDELLLRLFVNQSPPQEVFLGMPSETAASVLALDDCAIRDAILRALARSILTGLAFAIAVSFWPPRKPKQIEELLQILVGSGGPQGGERRGAGQFPYNCRHN